MTLEQTIKVPADGHVHLDFTVPEELFNVEAVLMILPMTVTGSLHDNAREKLPFQKIPNWRDPEVQARSRANAHKRIGCMKGKISVPDDFDTMMQDEIIAMFEGDVR